MTEEEIKTLTNIYTDHHTCMTQKRENVTLGFWTSPVCAYNNGDYVEVSNNKAILTKDPNRETGSVLLDEEGEYILIATYCDVEGDVITNTTFKLTLTSSNSLSTGGGGTR